MGERSNTDKAIRNIMNWADRPEWSDEQAAVFDAHLAPVCDRIGISQEELGQELAEHGYGGMLFGLMFEDFVSRRLPPGDRNIIDDYLKRRGWHESVPGRQSRIHHHAAGGTCRSNSRAGVAGIFPG